MRYNHESRWSQTCPSNKSKTEKKILSFFFFQYKLILRRPPARKPLTSSMLTFPVLYRKNIQNCRVKGGKKIISKSLLDSPRKSYKVALSFCAKTYLKRKRYKLRELVEKERKQIYEFHKVIRVREEMT